MAGFEVTLYGRIWVTPEDIRDSLVRRPFAVIHGYNVIVTIGPRGARRETPDIHAPVFDGASICTMRSRPSFSQM